jgi:hypothetical protein
MPTYSIYRDTPAMLTAAQAASAKVTVVKVSESYIFVETSSDLTGAEEILVRDAVVAVAKGIVKE